MADDVQSGDSWDTATLPPPAPPEFLPGFPARNLSQPPPIARQVFSGVGPAPDPQRAFMKRAFQQYGNLPVDQAKKAIETSQKFLAMRLIDEAVRGGMPMRDAMIKYGLPVFNSPSQSYANTVNALTRANPNQMAPTEQQVNIPGYRAVRDERGVHYLKVPTATETEPKVFTTPEGQKFLYIPGGKGVHPLKNNKEETEVKSSLFDYQEAQRALHRARLSSVTDTNLIQSLTDEVQRAADRLKSIYKPEETTTATATTPNAGAPSLAEVLSKPPLPITGPFVPMGEGNAPTLSKPSAGKLTKDQAKAFLSQAGGDKDKARQLARNAGYEF